MCWVGLQEREGGGGSGRDWHEPNKLQRIRHMRCASDDTFHLRLSLCDTYEQHSPVPKGVEAADAVALATSTSMAASNQARAVRRGVDVPNSRAEDERRCRTSRPPVR